MRVLRWTLLLFYVGLVGGLFALGAGGDEWFAIVPLAVILARNLRLSRGESGILAGDLSE
jgi:hypothetical protein